MIIKIPFKTPTINHLYWHRGNMKIMKTEAKKLREEIKKIVQSDTSGLYDIQDCKLSVQCEIHENWFTKKGDVARKDIANREKFLIDSVFDGLGIDDKFIFEHKFTKIQNDQEFALVKINSLE